MGRRRRVRAPVRTAWLAGIALVVLGCAAAPAPSPSGAPSVDVVTTTTVFADLVAQVGGDRVSVSSLVPRGAEVHTFDPTPSMARRVAAADLLVMNGLGLDDWLRRLASDAGSDARVLVLGEELPGVSYVASGDAAAPNPHLWLDATYAEGYVERIADAMAALDPPAASGYRAAARTYLGQLSELDAWGRATMARIPADRRRIVAFHDALPYFARAYGLEIVGVVLPAPGQDPSAADIARLTDEIRSTGARAIVSEVQFGSALAETLAAETGVALVSDLYTDTLGDRPLDSYLAIMRWDIERMAAALQ